MTKIERKIIQLLSDYPEQEFYGGEITRKIGCSKASASVILRKFFKKKLIFMKAKGHMKFYQINTKSSEIKKIKIDVVLEKMNNLLPKVQKFSQKIILFGSGARGEQTAESDIDLFIMSRKKNEIRAVLKDINLGLAVNAIIKTPSEWSEMEVAEPEFYQEINNGIILYDYVSRI
ncbi:MAG: DNA polymerase beta subunit [uncultured bacterium]|nr:MAG: DNA polymerase beta subunit [uncultured bacterium]HBR79964.1 hypothetical protein [Candidatus Moranbacteria bacterium]